MDTEELFFTVDSTAVQVRCKEAHQITGLYSRVAARLGLTSNHVREVALGNRKSSKVMQALCAEMKRIERSARKAATA